MATKYSDFIHLQNFLPVYDILEEGASSWQSFIPTAQFNEMLHLTLSLPSNARSPQLPAAKSVKEEASGYAVLSVPVKVTQVQ